jgi:hypothetical protein
VLQNDAASNDKYGGHVPRNTRLALSAIDLVQPYVCISATSPLLTAPSLKNIDSMGLRWYVGGSVTVDRTWLSWHHVNTSVSSLSPEEWEGVVQSITQPQPPTEPHSTWKDGASAVEHSRINSNTFELHVSGTMTGPARWQWTDPLDTSTANMFEVNNIHLPPLRYVKGLDERKLKGRHGGVRGENSGVGIGSSSSGKGGGGSGVEVEMLLIAWAEVDQSWGNKGQGYPAAVGDAARLRKRRRNHRHLRASPLSSFSAKTGNEANNTETPTVDGKRHLAGDGFPPQSHMSNARTNPEWVITNEKGEVKVKGRKFWPSDPIVVKVRYDVQPGGGDASQSLSTIVSVQSAVTECAWWKRGSSSKNKS